MRFSIITFLAILLAFNSYSQQQTQMNQESVIPLMQQELGGFGGPQFKMTQVNGQGCMIGGGPIALVVRPDLKWFASFNYMEGGPDSMKIWFVGLGGEYTFLPGSFIELNLSSQLGIGSAAQKMATENVATTLFTFEPELTAGIKIMQFDKIKIGAGYRFAYTTKSLGDLTTENLSGFCGVVSLVYGIFDVDQRKAYLTSHKPKPYLSGTYSMKFTRLNGQSAILDGGGTRIFLHRKLGIGISGYRTIKTVDYKGNEFSIVYGGAWIYYPFNMLKQVHLSFSGLVGYGGVGYVRNDTQEMVGKGMPVIDSDLFANLNVTEFMQLGIGVGYRLALTGFEDVAMSNISGMTTTFQVRFGAF